MTTSPWLRLPFILLLIFLSTLQQALARGNGNGKDGNICLSSSPSINDRSFYIFDRHKKCKNEVEIKPDIGASLCSASYVSYHFEMCGKDVIVSVNGGEGSKGGAVDVDCGIVLHIDGVAYQGTPLSEVSEGDPCYSKRCEGKDGRPTVYGEFGWEGLPICSGQGMIDRHEVVLEYDDVSNVKKERKRAVEVKW